VAAPFAFTVALIVADDVVIEVGELTVMDGAFAGVAVAVVCTYVAVPTALTAATLK
jgi:hypothetical protein